MGRDPGMLIRIRVVSVVSVLRSSGCAAGRPASAPASETTGVPYGGVPEGYAAPPRPLGPEDGVSVSRLKAGSPGWLHRPFRPLSGGSAARTTILATSGAYPMTAGETGTGLARARYGEVVRHLPSRTVSPSGCRPGPSVAHITATAMPPSRKR
ncbi:hypothetical protein F7R91_11210 [Streptomyces luteolifulvus]|uniref:Uncharacterized protein n=1 Tax=Streptomyces luteolifulvus TaxID=2615112 RepID=A0A6H9V183_9ACTN|nr:hypothetical protein F7R91_11210 [Streptomyces luteolifulvus]